MLSYNDLFSKCTISSTKLTERIAVAERDNALLEKVLDKQAKFNSAYIVLIDKLHTTQEMLKEINIASREYRDKRKSFIIESIENALSLAFNDDYKVKIEMSTYGDRVKAKLRLETHNEDGTTSFYIPKKQNGGLCRQTISLSGSLAIAELLGCHILFMDEALNGGDSVSMQKLQKLLVDFVADENNQIILNEHNGSLYKNISCRRFMLSKVGKGQEGYVTVDSVEDLIGEDLSEIELGEEV